jgi:predicted nucleic acid-binding protein
MKTDIYVIDASVSAKWFLHDEELVDVAEDFLTELLADKIELHAPIILQYELAHTLTKTQRQKGRPLTPKMCIDAYQSFSGYHIVFHNIDYEERMKALKFANKFHRGFYDSTYIGLAIKLDCPWLTSEKTFRGVLPPGFPRKHILTLESLV